MAKKNSTDYTLAISLDRVTLEGEMLDVTEQGVEFQYRPPRRSTHVVVIIPFNRVIMSSSKTITFVGKPEDYHQASAFAGTVSAIERHSSGLMEGADNESNKVLYNPDYATLGKPVDEDAAPKKTKGEKKEKGDKKKEKKGKKSKD